MWEIDGIPLVNRGDTRLARTTEIGRELAVVEFRDARDVLFVSSVHISEEDMKPLLYRCAGSGGPWMSFVPSTIRIFCFASAVVIEDGGDKGIGEARGRERSFFIHMFLCLSTPWSF